MRPDPNSLRKYQIAYHSLNGPTAVSGQCMQWQWRCLLLVVFLSLVFTFGYWTFQSGIGSPYLFEQFGELSLSKSGNHPTNNSPTLSPFAPQESQEYETFRSSNNTLNFLLPNTSTSSIASGILNTSTSSQNSSSKILPNIIKKSQKLFTNLTTILQTSSKKFANPPHQRADNQSFCPATPPGLIGPIPVWLDAPEFAQLAKLYPLVKAGGHNWPEKCASRHRVAIVVPYRDRETHLRVFLHNLHFLLTKQQLDYAIFIVEQANNQTFNRGKLMNVGFVEASRLYDWQCFIFHDVDLLPEDDRNLYSCPEQPRHMSVAVDKFKYILPYSQIFGGATALTRKQFERLNGFSNDYWGWGGEDDDISYRVTYAGYTISRYPKKIARYKMIKHKQESSNPVNACRWEILQKTKERWRRDGLSNLNYSVLLTQINRLYTKIRVDLLENESRKALSEEHINIKKGC